MEGVYLNRRTPLAIFLASCSATSPQFSSLPQAIPFGFPVIAQKLLPQVSVRSPQTISFGFTAIAQKLLPEESVRTKQPHALLPHLL
jgi:hypothetical protein